MQVELTDERCDDEVGGCRQAAERLLPSNCRIGKSRDFDVLSPLSVHKQLSPRTVTLLTVRTGHCGFAMVRLKHRYLLVDILYPEHTSSASRGTTIDKALPLALQFHAPTPDGLTIQLLTRLIRDGVNDAFGEYGAGVVASSLQGQSLSTETQRSIAK